MKKNKNNQIELIDVFIGLAQATRCCRQDNAFCGGVTFHQFVILDAVVEKSTTTRLLNPLLAKGLLSKERSISDSRAFVLTLTKNGRETHRRVQTCLEDFFSKVAGNLPAGQQAIILQAVQIFISAIKNASGTFNCCS
jgi:hypothetical protein